MVSGEWQILNNELPIASHEMRQHESSTPSNSQRSGSSSNRAHLPRRPYGDSGRDLSIVGFGGILVTNEDEQTLRNMASPLEPIFGGA